MKLLVSELVDARGALKRDGMIIEYEFSEHASDMLRERNIQEDWVKVVIEDPERKEMKEDGTVHYIRVIEQYGGRYLRVLVNPNVRPPRAVTVFFDRRIMRRSQ